MLGDFLFSASGESIGAVVPSWREIYNMDYKFTGNNVVNTVQILVQTDHFA